MRLKTPKQKSVLVGTVSERNSVSLEYSFSLAESAKVGLSQSALINPMLCTSSGNTTMRLNQLITIAWERKVDSLILISPDASWSPEAMMAVVDSDTEVVALPVCGSSGFLVGITDVQRIQTKEETGEIKVKSVNLEFFKMGIEVLQSLCESSPTIQYEGGDVKAVISGADFSSVRPTDSEILLGRIQECGYEIWLNPNHTVQTTTVGRTQGDFLAAIGVAKGE